MEKKKLTEAERLLDSMFSELGVRFSIEVGLKKLFLALSVERKFTNNLFMVLKWVNFCLQCVAIGVVRGNYDILMNSPCDGKPFAGAGKCLSLRANSISMKFNNK